MKWYLNAGEVDDMLNASWQDVEKAFHEIPDESKNSNGDLSLSESPLSKDGTVMILCYDPESRLYYVSTMDKDEGDWYDLVNPDAPAKEIDAIIGGQRIPHLLSHLVTEETALKALKCFYDTGKRSSDLHWNLPWY